MEALINNVNTGKNIKMKKVNYTIIFCMFSFLIVAQNLQFDWANATGADGYDEQDGIAVDGFGNVYSLGTFSGIVDFDPGVPVYTMASFGNDDVYITKSDANGNFIWAKQFGGTNNEFGASMKLDSQGNIYFTGTFAGTTDFNPSAGVNTLTSAGYTDAFICKLDANGNFLWAKNHGGVNSEYGHALCLDANDNVYTTGLFQSTVDFNPGIGTYNLSSGGSSDCFISKLDASGNFVWAVSVGGSGGDQGLFICSDANNIYVTGIFQSTVDFDPSAGIFNLTSNSVASDLFILKLTQSASFVWAKSIGGSGGDRGQDISVDQSGNVYTTGIFSGTVDFDPGVGTFNLVSDVLSYDAFICKLDATGNLVWAKAVGGAGSDSGYGIALDANNVYLTGSYEQTVDFNPNAGVNSFTAFGSSDIFIIKFSNSGNYIWGGSIGDVYSDEARTIETDVFGNIYASGLFEGTMDFNVNSGIYNLTSQGYSDAFILKLSTCNVPSPPMDITNTANLTICEGNTTSLSVMGSGALNWYANANSTVVLYTGTTFTTPPLSAGNYTYYIEAYTCDASASRTAITVTVNANPVVTANNPTVCAGTTVTLTVTGADTYDWGNGNYTDTMIVTPFGPASYMVDGISSNGCFTTINVDVTVNQLPNVTLASLSSPMCLNDAAASLTGSPNGGAYSGIGVSGVSFDPSVSGAGTFTITYNYMDANTCSASASNTVTVSLCTGVAESLTDNNNIRIYPNPANGEFTVILPTKGTYHIIDAIGQTVSTITVDEDDQNIKFNNLSQGIYYVVGKSTKAKIIVAK